MELEELLNQLIELNYEDGRHSGMWSCIEDKECVGNRYLEKIIPYANTFQVPYNNKLQHNFTNEEWEDYKDIGIGYAMEELAHRLKTQCQEKILQQIKENRINNIAEEIINNIDDDEILIETILKQIRWHVGEKEEDELLNKIMEICESQNRTIHM